MSGDLERKSALWVTESGLDSAADVSNTFSVSIETGRVLWWIHNLRIIKNTLKHFFCKEYFGATVLC